jgi:multicomponent K+:H+ antiporter subunit D
MPPLSGFLAKFAMITALFNPQGMGVGAGISAQTWTVVAFLILSGLAIMIALVRTGINTFWVSFDSEVPSVRAMEMAPVLMLLGLCVLLTVMVNPAMSYFEAAAQALHTPTAYIDAVFGPAAGGKQP